MPNTAESTDRTLRLLYGLAVSNESVHGGIETYGRELVAAMSVRGHRVELLDIGEDAVYRQMGFRDRWPRPELLRRYYFWKRRPYQDYRYHTVLRRQSAAITSRFQPHVVHVLHLHAYGAILGSRAPCVVSAHGLEVEPIPPVIGSAQMASAVHAVSHFTSTLVTTRLPASAPVTVLAWGIKRRSTVRDATPSFDLITVSRLIRRKNVDTVLRALERRPHLRYAIVGDGPELSGLRDLAASLHLTNVTFVGAVDEHRKRELLDRSRLFVMCPRATPADVEGLGLVYFEALEAGLPIVGSNNGGVPDAVGAAGVLVEDPEDADEVGRAIDAGLAPESRERFLAAVQARRTSCSWEAFLDRFEGLYRRVART